MSAPDGTPPTAATLTVIRDTADDVQDRWVRLWLDGAFWEILRYGQRIAVVGLPAHDLMKTPKALEIVGPKAFGYPDLTFRPLAAGPIAA